MSEKLDKLRASLEKEKERRIKMGNESYPAKGKIRLDLYSTIYFI